MSSITNKIESWYSSLKKPEISYEKKGIRPGKGWRLIFSIAFLILFILAGVASYLYIQIDTGQFFETENKDFMSEVKINNLLLKKVIDDIDQREKSLEEIRSGKIAPPSPGL